MNCQDFESNIDGLARGALMDARVREVAHAHESECARCAARLEDERALTSGLRALAAETKEMEAPARVEASLLSAFRARDGFVQLPASETVRVWPWTKTLVVASLAAAASLALFMLIPPDMLKTKAVVTGNQAAEVKKNAPPTKALEPSTMKDETSFSPNDEVLQTAPPQTIAGYSRADEPRRTTGRVVRATPASLGANGARGNTKAQQDFTQTASNEEITTDFIPLMQGGRLTQGEGSHLVRVELPRSALERFGLPVNAESAGGRVKADVLLGEDGLARAIRFVR